MYLILKLFAVDRCAATACAGWIARLEHEIGYYAVEDDVVVVTALDKSREVFAGLQDKSAIFSMQRRMGSWHLWGMIIVEFDCDCALQTVRTSPNLSSSWLTMVVSRTTSVAIRF